jgi:hypothetical protein
MGKLQELIYASIRRRGKAREVEITDLSLVGYRNDVGILIDKSLKSEVVVTSGDRGIGLS